MGRIRSWNREVGKLAAVFFTIYFVQGMSTLPGLPVSYLIKNVLKLSPADAQFFGAATMLAWLVKPIWGYLSDTFPIMGYRRKSYLIGMSLIAASSWFTLAWFAAHNDYRYWTLLILFNFSAMAYAFVDVVCDGLMVENGKRAGLVDQFVNVQWIGAGVAGVVVGLLSGELARIANTRPDFYAVIFSAAGIVPLATALLVFFLLKEEPTERPFPWLKLGVALVVIATLVSLMLQTYPWIPLGKGWLIFLSAFMGSAAAFVVTALETGRWFSYGIIKRTLAILSLGVPAVLMVQWAQPRMWFFSLGMGERILTTFIGFSLISIVVWFWAGRPRFFWAMNLFIFFWGFSPSVGMARFYYLSDVLKFSEDFFGFLSSLDSVFSVIGFALYALVLAKRPSITRRQYLYFSIALGTLGLGIQYLYYLNPALGLNYYAIAIASGILFSVLGAPAWLIPLAIAGDAAKNGKEAVTYAWFMSASNFARLTFSDLTGGWLYQALEKADFHSLALLVGSGDFLGADANKVLILRLFVWISALFTLAAIPVVYFVRFPERGESSKD